MTQEQVRPVDEREAAKYLGVSAACLRFWRTEGKGPRFFRAGEKLVRYRRVDLDAWIEERMVLTSEDYGKPHAWRER